MKKDIILTVALLYFISGIHSCGLQNGNTVIIHEKIKDTIEREIPLDKSGNRDKAYLDTRHKAAQLELDAIDNLGYDSLQLRIWFNYSLAIQNHLIVLKNNKKGWLGQLFTFEVDSETIPGHDSIVKKTVQSIIPKSGWHNLIKSLNEYKIWNMPSDSSGGADGTSYCIELATKNKYKFFRMWGPEYDKGNLYSENMVKILQLLENEFDFRRIQK